MLSFSSGGGGGFHFGNAIVGGGLGGHVGLQGHIGLGGGGYPLLGVVSRSYAEIPEPEHSPELTLRYSAWIAQQLNLGGPWDGQVHNPSLRVPGTNEALMFFREGEDDFKVVLGARDGFHSISGNSKVAATALRVMNIPGPAGGARGLAYYLRTNGAFAPSPPPPAAPTGPITPTALAPPSDIIVKPLAPAVAHAPPRQSLNENKWGSVDPNDIRANLDVARGKEPGLDAGYGVIIPPGANGGDSYIITHDGKTGEEAITPMDSNTMRVKEGQKIRFKDPAKLNQVIENMKTGGAGAVQKLFQHSAPAAAAAAKPA